MFHISTKHMQAYAQERLDAFAERMVQRLKTRFPGELAEHGISFEELPAVVRNAMARADQQGVVREMDLELFVDCIALLSPNFDSDPRFPWAGETLRRVDLDGTAKMDVIHDYLVFDTERAHENG